MSQRSQLLLLAASLLAAASAQATVEATKLAAAGEIEFFEKKIRPVLVASCYKCHSTEGEKIKGGLTLDTRESLLKGGDSGAAIVPGEPDKSLLVKSMRHDDPDLSMPPKSDKLPDEVIANFEKWVKMGAPDPRVAKAAAPAVKAWDMNKARQEHWAFKPVSKAAPPAVSDPKHFIQNPIDSFVLAKLEEKGLRPSPKADKHTLIRRATYDLIGLPPTPEEVEEFLADDSADAFAKVVDRLLASPRYGERWGRHWLDIARYADTSGDRLAGNKPIPLYPYAWTYRDWVIQAINEDVPYNQFVLEQIAGDSLPEAQRARDAKEVLPALGFLTVGKRFMGNANDVIDDQIDVVGKGLLGLTISCARCHDHKFDPIPTKDYYSLHGVFNSCKEPDDKPLLEHPEDDPQYQDFLKEIAKVEAEVTAFNNSESARLLGGMLEKAGDYLLFLNSSKLSTDSTKKGGNFRVAARQAGIYAELAQVWLENFKEAKVKESRVFSPWYRFTQIPEAQMAERAHEVAAEIAAADESEVHPLFSKAFREVQPSSLKEVAAIYTEIFGKLHQELNLKEYTFARGKELTKVDQQPPLADPEMESLRQELYGPASFLRPDHRNIASALGVNFTTNESRIRGDEVRLNMFHPGAPARAMVLVDAPKPKDSFVMIRGEATNKGPVVPRQFPEIIAGENRKPFTIGSGRLEMAQAIVDPKNPLTPRVIANRVWQWHFGQAIVRTVSDFGTRSEPPTHLELLDYLGNYLMENGWSLKKLHRLIMLSGVYQQESQPNKKGMHDDPTNQWLWRANVQRLDLEQIRDSLLVFGGHLDLTMGGPPVPLVNEDKKAGGSKTQMPTTTEDQQSRRTVYGVVDRAGLPGVFSTFDFANPDMTTGERILTTVPQQALFLMNSPFIVLQVKRLLARPDFPARGTTADKVSFIYSIVFQRAPSDAELKMAEQFIEGETLVPVPAPETASIQTIAMPAASETKERKSASSSKRKSSESDASLQLNAWERYTQVVLLANETVFLN